LCTVLLMDAFLLIFWLVTKFFFEMGGRGMRGEKWVECGWWQNILMIRDQGEKQQQQHYQLQESHLWHNLWSEPSGIYTQPLTPRPKTPGWHKAETSS
jgi:hypothetical protein